MHFVCLVGYRFGLTIILDKGERNMNEVRTIKRYQNRKLYDTHQSCYVTLEEIAHIVREGHEIEVIDNRTKNDITYNTQIQLLFDQERKSTERRGDTELLKRVIRSSGGTFTSYICDLESASKEKEEEEDKLGNTDEFSFMTGQSQNEMDSSTETATTLN